MKRSVFVGAKPTDKNRKKPLKTDKDDLSVYIPDNDDEISKLSLVFIKNSDDTHSRTKWIHLPVQAFQEDEDKETLVEIHLVALDGP